ncbi:MAG: glycosyltransferase family 39 protein [Bacteroidales bacterium]|nr:glycosyltransferase family 39 protein [Bacteroidales bacterium]
MNIILKSRENFLLILILIIATILRFYNYYGWSLSNDELSALNRLKFDNFSQLIKNGVMLNDMHPAGVQVFLYYWTEIFGYSEASIRFPFVIAGIVSVYIAYLISVKWFDKGTALLVCSTLAVLQYPILYSQLARPYSFGLLFSLLTVWFFTKIFFGNGKNKILNHAGYILSITFCAYTHYYCFLFVIMVWFTSLYFLNDKNVKFYILTLIICIILYLPALNTFYYHFFVKGGLIWPGKPDGIWILKYFKYSFNNVCWFSIMIFLIFIISVIMNFKKNKLSKFQIVAISWFLLHFLIGYLYSVFINPILQYSILLFSFPFLVMFLFSFIKKNELQIYLVFVILITGIYSTVFGNKFYKTEHFADFKNIANDIVDMNKKYGYNNITRTININSPEYLNYYLLKKKVKVDFKEYQNNGGDDYLKFRKIVENSDNPYFLNAWLSCDPLELEDIILTKYPYIVECNDYVSSTITLYSKKKPSGTIEIPKPTIMYKNEFEGCELWGGRVYYQSKQFAENGKYSYVIDSLEEYGPTFSIPINDLIDWRKINSYKICLDFYSDCFVKDATLIFQICHGEKIYEWKAMDFGFYSEKGKWNKIFLNGLFPEIKSKKDILSIFVCNKGREKFYIDNFEIKFYKEKLFYKFYE